MRPFLTRVVAICTVLAVAATAAVDLTAAMSAMKCCAKAHGKCARLKTPDDCCRGMGHLAAGPVSATPEQRASVVPIAHATEQPPTVADLRQSIGARADAPQFKRPHDPPHLHPAPLLI